MRTFTPLTAEEWRCRLGLELDERELRMWNAVAWAAANDRRLRTRLRRVRMRWRIRRLGLDGYLERHALVER